MGNWIHEIFFKWTFDFPHVCNILVEISKFFLCLTFFPLYISFNLTEFLKQNISWRNWIVKWFHGTFIKTEFLLKILLNIKVISRNIFLKHHFSWKYYWMMRWFHGISWFFVYLAWFMLILASIRTIRNTRTIRVFCQKLFYIRHSTIPTRTGNPNARFARRSAKS